MRWKNYQKMLVPDVCPHNQDLISVKEAKSALKNNEGILVRWISNWDCNDDTNWWYVIAEKPLDLNTLKSKHRSEIKRGLNNCTVKLVNGHTILKDNAYNVYKNAFFSYNTELSLKSEHIFRNEIAELDENWDLWAVYYGQTLISYSLNYICEDTAEYKIVKIDPNYKKFYPAYALFFEMNNYYLKKRGFKYVNDGARSISHETNIQDFLIKKFNFRKAYCTLNIIYRRDIQLLINILHPFRRILALIPKSFAKRLSVLLLQDQIANKFKDA